MNISQSVLERTDKALQRAAKEAKEAGLDALPVALATRVLNEVHGTSYSARYTPLHRALLGGDVKGTKLLGAWYVDPADLRGYVIGFVSRTKGESKV